MRITEMWGHRFGDRILRDSPEIEELISGLKSIRLSVCVGFKRPPFDIKQGLLNKMIDYVFV